MRIARPTSEDRRRTGVSTTRGSGRRRGRALAAPPPAKRCAERGPHAEHVEEAGRDPHARDLLRLGPAAQVVPAARRVEERDVRERAAALLTSRDSSAARRCSCCAGSLTPPCHTRHQAIGICERQRPQDVEFTTLNIVVFAPMPSASVSTATAVKPGAAAPQTKGVPDIAAQRVHAHPPRAAPARRAFL